MQPSIDNLLLGNVRIVVVSGAYGRALYAQLAFFVDPMVTPCSGSPMVPILYPEVGLTLDGAQVSVMP